MASKNTQVSVMMPLWCWCIVVFVVLETAHVMREQDLAWFWITAATSIEGAAFQFIWLIYLKMKSKP
ncbi:hypothetical protein BET10_16160 [Pseudoalteromonas amylolytica]|uniref:Uncharacterized protein n=1 Tax=Pseudoalteromonas amylolytica TaxID=1859457 RepID=A0A1S1MS32_9GAMM|nr:hypothetical protein BFC16_16160 [Pseudoalteromonas sp. JW3]OHU89659.1 hypothetical protein BET10_16160 [Pseudoalteromonas amylolytica]